MPSAYLIDDGIIGFFDNFGPAEDAREAFEDAAREILDYAQSNAPWEDRTGDAREGLSVEVSVNDGEVWLELFHTVEYGLWLEVIQSGRFAIIMPTLERFAPEVFEKAGARIIDGVGS